MSYTPRPWRGLTMTDTDWHAGQWVMRGREARGYSERRRA